MSLRFTPSALLPSGLLCLLLLLFLPLLAPAADASVSISRLDALLGLRWGLDNEENAIRFHLWYKTNRSALLPCLDGDDAACYWVAGFLSDPAYLQGNAPENGLALVLYTNVIERNLVAASADPGFETLRQQARARALRCLLAHRMGLFTLAEFDGAWLNDRRGSLGGMLPAVDDEDKAVLRRYTSVY